MTHDLKLNARYYQAVLAGFKPFEVRYNDREFHTGDTLRLHEITPTSGCGYSTNCTHDECCDYRVTGRVLSATVTYILDDQEYVKPGYVVLGIRDVREVSK